MKKLLAVAAVVAGLLGAGGSAHAKPQLCVVVRTPNYVPVPDGAGGGEVSIPQLVDQTVCTDLP